MEMDRHELFKKRNVVRNALRTLAFDMDLDLYFADRQNYDEIKAVFVRDDEDYRIICKLNEMTDICEAINNVREYLSTIPGRTLADTYIVEDKDESSIYPSVMNSFKFDVDYANRLCKRMLNYQYGYKPVIPSYFKIDKVIFNDPATIVIWADGSKTVVKCQPGDTFDKEKGLAMAISKRALGDKGRYLEEFKKWIPAVEEEVKVINAEEIVGPYEDAMRAMKNLEKAFKKCHVTIPELKINYPKNLFGLKNVNENSEV